MPDEDAEPATVSIRICLEGHANALALNKDHNQIAVAGRSLLKVYAIDNYEFTEVGNMRGKNQNLSYSSNDVAWSTLDSNILATAATNGVVSVWDLSKFGKQKQLHVYNEHERTAHTVTFHTSEPILISGSQDGTIKCFDFRTDKSVNTFFSNSESVRDLKFSPHSQNMFSAVSENGTVQIWDLRKIDKCMVQFTAHSGPIYTCDWHPTRNWLATGSRDKQIKVWNMDARASLEYTIHTIAVVGRVKWRPERTYHIASCALSLSPNLDFVAEDTTNELRVHECFIGCAKELLLSGQKLADLCERNAEVSKKYGKHNATTLWNFIKLFYGSNHFEPPFEHRSSFSNQKNPLNARRALQTASEELGQDLNGDEAPHENVADSEDADDLGGVGQQQPPPTSSVILSETQIISEITFDNFELLRNGFIYVGPADVTKALAFPDTALHHDVQAARPQLDLKVSDHEKSPPPHVPSILKVSHIPPIRMWEPHQFVADALMLQNDVGDVQTALTVLIALGDARNLLPLEDRIIEHWFHTYVDQLQRYELWNEACAVINRAWMRSVRQLNQASTVMHTNCGECGRPLGGNVGWYCDKCRSMQSAKCCVCGLIVRGFYAWCQGCSHGGHIEHLQQYFAKHAKCPKCGHLCAYS
ncbi:CG7609 [Drosophila busckii]|uniref:GATOR2 complex protein WDR24 n=1 Tax=Drosophila busckii TaxID=30019 RepID=A0A0M4EL39_DROBS|nr:CG7609 [Drosophila busckii]